MWCDFDRTDHISVTVTGLTLKKRWRKLHTATGQTNGKQEGVSGQWETRDRNKKNQAKRRRKVEKETEEVRKESREKNLAALEQCALAPDSSHLNHMEHMVLWAPVWHTSRRTCPCMFKHVYYIHWYAHTFSSVHGGSHRDRRLVTRGFPVQILAVPTGMKALCPPAARWLCEALHFQQLERKLLSGCSVFVRMCATHTIQIKIHPNTPRNKLYFNILGPFLCLVLLFYYFWGAFNIFSGIYIHQNSHMLDVCPYNRILFCTPYQNTCSF